MTKTATWFITGISSGIGRALTEALLERGDRVVGTLRRLGSVDDLLARYGNALHAIPLDVTDVHAVRDVVDRAFAESGPIDVVVSNAGFGLFGAAEEVSDDQIRALIDTNLIGSIAVIRAALPHMRAQGGGRFVQVSSEGGQIAYPGFSIYHAAKWGIEGFVESVAAETAPFGIAFTIVEPGPTRTNFRGGMVKAPPLAAYAGTPAGELRQAIASGAFALPGDADSVARAIVEATAQSPAPRRLTLGAGSYTRIRAALAERLAELDAQREVAYAADRGA